MIRSLRVFFLLGLSVLVLFVSSFPAIAQDNSEEIFTVEWLMEPDDCEQIESSLEIVQFVKQYEEYLAKRAKVRETFHNIHSLDGSFERKEEKPLLIDKGYAAEFAYQMDFIGYFLRGLMIDGEKVNPNGYGYNKNLYWKRTYDLVAAQGRFAAAQIRDILEKYKDKTDPVLYSAFSKVEANISNALKQHDALIGNKVYWKDAAIYLYKVVTGAGNDIWYLIKKLLPANWPKDATPVLKGLTRVMAALHINQSSKGVGDTVYWIRTHHTLSFIAVQTAHYIEKLDVPEDVSLNNAVRTLTHIASNLRKYFYTYNYGSGGLLYWRKAAHEASKCLRDAGEALKNLSDLL